MVYSWIVERREPKACLPVMLPASFLLDIESPSYAALWGNFALAQNPCRVGERYLPDDSFW